MKSTKRNAVPRFWSIEIKKTKFVSSLFPGPHSKKESVPLIILLRDILKIADTKKEINQILNARQVLVDNTVRTDVRFPVGLFDSVAIPSLNLFYRVTFNKIGHINAVKIDKSESSEKLGVFFGACSGSTEPAMATTLVGLDKPACALYWAGNSSSLPVGELGGYANGSMPLWPISDSESESLSFIQSE